MWPVVINVFGICYMLNVRVRVRVRVRMCARRGVYVRVRRGVCVRVRFLSPVVKMWIILS